MDRCPTCDEPYNKQNPSSRAQICSNPFHCCRDCEWSVEHHEWYTTGEMVKFCDYHKKLEQKL